MGGFGSLTTHGRQADLMTNLRVKHISNLRNSRAETKKGGVVSPRLYSSSVSLWASGQLLDGNDNLDSG
jgi:hypothetical protein